MLPSYPKTTIRVIYRWGEKQKNRRAKPRRKSKRPRQFRKLCQLQPLRQLATPKAHPQKKQGCCNGLKTTNWQQLESQLLVLGFFIGLTLLKKRRKPKKRQ